MLVGTPRPVNLSVFNALGPTLWIRRARFESWRGNSSCYWVGVLARIRDGGLRVRCAPLTLVRA